MRRVEVLLIAAFERNMGGDERAVLEDAYLVGEYVNIKDTATCGVGDAIEIAANAHHALMGEPSFELQHRAIGSKWQWLERRLFFGEGLTAAVWRKWFLPGKSRKWPDIAKVMS
jgi:hypothetical protein